jgi:hypothetical protein
VAARNFERTAVDADTNAQCLLDRTDVTIVLPEQFGEEAMVVEMKFERILAGWLRNGPV